MNYGSPSPAARSLADMVIGHVDRQSPHIDDSARADALALAFVDVAERVYPGGLAKGCTTGVDFEREGVMVRVVALEVPPEAPVAPAADGAPSGYDACIEPGDDARRDIKPDNATLSYGSDDAGGVYLHLGAVGPMPMGETRAPTSPPPEVPPYPGPLERDLAADPVALSRAEAKRQRRNANRLATAGARP